MTAAGETDPKTLYRFNYDYVAPVPFAHELPPGEQPTVSWYTTVIWQLLRNLRNRLNWLAERQSDDASVSFSIGDDPPPAPDATLALDGLGLDEPINLDHLDLTQKTAEDADANVSFGIGETLSALAEAGRIAKAAIKIGINDPMRLLEIVGRASEVADSSRPGSLAAYVAMFKVIEAPWFANAEHALDDATFAWLRVAGPNPLTMRRIQRTGEGFPVTEAHYQTAMKNSADSLTRAGDEGRLFLADYAMLDGVPDGTAPYPKYSVSPKALFALPVGEGPRRIAPVAIQCGQDPAQYEIFTPDDGEGWMKAKFTVQVADGNHHQTISHLGRTHLLIAPIVICTRRQLADDHPISRLLRPHFEGTLAINDGARLNMIAPGGPVDRSLSAPIAASVGVSGKAFLEPFFNYGALPDWINSRGLDSPDLEYPYRDDSALTWKAIADWVGSYVRAHYLSDAAIAQDPELQAWGAEIVAQDGGRVPAFGEDDRGKITTVDYLAQALTMIIFTASAQHAAVNFAQGEMMTSAAMTPFAAFAPPPKTRAEGAKGSWLEMVAPTDLALFQAEFMNQLGGVHYTKLGDYESGWFKDAGRTVSDALERFQGELELAGAEIERRNISRVGPYRVLIPSRIPQSINI